MSFAWPLALLSLLVVPALLAAYWWMLRRRRKQAVRYSSVALLRSVLPQRKRWQRHLPVALLLREPRRARASPPAARTWSATCPTRGRRSSSRIDVSGSMCSTDVKPNRLAVAQQAAREFVEDQPKGVRMGLVVFSGFAELAVPPTTDRKALVAAIDSLTTGRGTAIGAAMLKGARRDRRGEPRRRRRSATLPRTGSAPPRRRSPARTATCPTSSCS